MRMLLVVLMTTAILGCSSSMKLPPVSPEDVEVYMPSMVAMAENYVVVWETRQVAVSDEAWNTYPVSYSNDRIVEDLKEEAAKRGADALLIDRIYRITHTDPTGESLPPEARVIARAVCFLDRHPELAEQK